MPIPARRDNHWFTCSRFFAGSGALYRAIAQAAALVFLFVLPGPVAAQPIPAFGVAVNTLAGQSSSIYPGEPTVLRVSLRNLFNPSDPSAADLTDVAFNVPLPNNPVNGLIVDGTPLFSGAPGCVPGTISTTNGDSNVVVSGITVPVSTALPADTGVCFIDIPVTGYSIDGVAAAPVYEIAAGAATANVSGVPGTNQTGGQQTITILGADRAEWSKQFLPDELVLGGAGTTLRITITNPDANVDLTGIGFTDVFPTSGGSAAFEPAGVATGSCLVVGGGSGTLTPTTGSSAQIVVQDVDLAAGASCAIDVPVTALQTGGLYELDLTNTIAAASFVSDQGLPPAADASGDVTVLSPLAIGKVFTPGIVASGVLSTFVVTLSNSSASALDIVSFTDSPIASEDPARLTIANATDVSTTCPGNPTTTIALVGNQGFTAGAFQVPANGSCTFSVDYTGTTPGNDTPSTYTNVIPEGAVDVDEGGGPEVISQRATATVLIADRLRVLKAVTPTTAAPGDAVRFSITVQNFDDTGSIGPVTVEDTLDNGATFLTGGAFDPDLTAACGSLGTVVDGSLTNLIFTIPTVPVAVGNTPGECVISFSAMIDPGASGATSNAIDANAVCFNGGATCNQVGSGDATSAFRAPFVFEKTFDNVNDASKGEGIPSRLRLRLTNNATGALSSVTFSDTLPTDTPIFLRLEVANPPNISNSCGGTVVAAAGDTSLALNGGAVPGRSGGVSGVCELALDVVGPAGTYANTANMGAVRTDADGGTTNLTDTDGAQLVYTDALVASKSFLPDTVSPGGTATARLRFENLDAARPITGITVTDYFTADGLPGGTLTGMAIANPANAYSTCSGAPLLTAVPGATSASIQGAIVGPGGSCDFLFDVTVTGTSDWDNIIPAGTLNADGGITNRNDLSATLTYVSPSDPIITKQIAPPTIVPGQSAVLTIDIDDTGQGMTGLAVGDFFTVDGLAGSMSNGMQIAPTPEASTTCSGGIVMAVAESTELRLSDATLLPGQSCSINVNVTSTVVGTIVNRIPVNAISSNEGLTNTLATSTSLSTSAEIGIAKIFEPSVVGANEPSRLRVTIFNARPQSITQISLLDSFPGGLALAPDPDPFSSCGGGAVVSTTASSLRLDGGSLGPAVGGNAASCVLEVNVVAASDGAYENLILQDTLELGGLPVTHPPASATLQVRERIVITKAIGGLTRDAQTNGFGSGFAVRLPGAAAPLAIRLENPNTIPLTEVTFTDVLPEGLTIASTPNASNAGCGGVFAPTPVAREISLTGATLPATGSCTVTVDVVGNVPGLYTNEIPAAAVTSFEGVDNFELTQAELLVSFPPTLSKDFAPPVIAPGVSATLTLIIGNDNAGAMTLDADLVDTLPTSPGAMTVASAGALSTSCAGPAPVAPLGGAAVTIPSSTVVPPGGCQVEFAVTASVPGDYVNTIPVAGLSTNFGPNDVPASAPLKVSTLGYIAGRVFLDNQTVPDGTYIPGQSTPLAGITVELFAGNTTSGVPIATTTTDSNGNYLFSELSAGTYSVGEPNQPADTLNSVTTPGTIIPVNTSTGTPGTAANPPGGNPSSSITGIVLGAGGIATEVSGSPENNFSEVLPAVISGLVYFDANVNGIADAGESGIGGVEITLTGPVNVIITTGPDGRYDITGLPPGTYTVTQTQPGGWVDGTTSAGTVDGVTVGSATPGIISSVTLGPGDAGVDYNFGEELPVVLTATVTPFCSMDAAYVSYLVGGSGPFPIGGEPPLTVSWFTAGARLAARFTDQPGSGELLWPGTEVGTDGVGVAWPGWAFVADEWVAVADDRLPTMTVRLAVGATFVDTVVTYPPAKANCLTQPPGTIAFAIPVASRSSLTLLALLLMLVGLWHSNRRPLSSAS